MRTTTGWDTLICCTKEIISDVWLYNRLPPPEVAPWKDAGAQMPFPNPAEYIAKETIIHEPSPDALSVSWSGGEPDAEAENTHGWSCHRLACF